jgi:dihydroorotase
MTVDAKSSWLIEKARLIDPSQSIDGIRSLWIDKGRVAGIDPAPDQIPEDLPRIDGTGCILAPGLIDIGTELGEPGREEDETIASGCQAALAGGFTSLACSAHTMPPIDSPAAVQFILEKASRLAACKVHVIGCVSKDRTGEQLAEIGSLVEAGVIAVSDAPRPIENTALLRRALEYCSMFGIPLLDQPEVRSLSPLGVMHEGLVQLQLGLPPMPAEAEDLATARDLRLLEATGGILHLVAVSTQGSVELCRRAKHRGLRFTAGVFPVNFHLTDESLRSFDSHFKVNPPLRSQEHVVAVQSALADGTIDIISSGHKARSLEKKIQEIDKAPFGMISLETTLAEVITHLIAPGILTWTQAIEKLSCNPARLLGLSTGTLRVGAPADLILVDPEERWTVDPDLLVSRGTNTPLAGHQLQGRVRQCMVDGQPKMPPMHP